MYIVCVVLLDPCIFRGLAQAKKTKTKLTPPDWWPRYIPYDYIDCLGRSSLIVLYRSLLNYKENGGVVPPDNYGEVKPDA